MDPHGVILPSRIVGALCLLFALIPGGIGYYLYDSTASFLEKAVSAEGTVIELRESEDADGASYYSVYEFTGRDGKTHRGVSGWSSNPPAHSVGETVDVLYVPGEPDSACLDHFVTLWLGPLVLGVVAIFPLTFAFAFLWLIPFAIKRAWPEGRAAAERTGRA